MSTIIQSITYGNYDYCFNTGKEWLTLSEDNTKNYHITLTIHVPEHLINKIDGLKITTLANPENVLQRTENGLTTHCTLEFAIPPHYQNKDMTIHFLKQTNNELKTIEKVNFTLTSLDIEGDSKKCSLCNTNFISNYNKNDIILRCYHKFHLNCLLNYIKTNNLVQENDECKKVGCKHTTILKHGNCPCCKK